MSNMKTVEVVYNTRERAGEKSPGKIYSEKLKVRRRREWRGLKDTLFDYSRWCYLMFGVLGKFILLPRNVKGFLRYRWMMSYLFVPHGMDKFTIGLRDEALRITHYAMNYVIADVTQAIANCFRGDRRVGNDVAYSEKCCITDENSMVPFVMGFDKEKMHTILREVPTMFASNIFHQFNVMHYLDVAQQNGIPGDVCPMPEAEAGVSMDDDFCVLGACAVQNNTTCDGSLMGNGIIAKRLEKQYGIPTYQLATPLRHQEEDVVDYAVEQIKGAIAFIVTYISDIFSGNFANMIEDLKWWGVAILVFLVISGIAYLIVAAQYGGKYIVMFTMDENGIKHEQIPAQKKNASTIGGALAGAGILTGNIGRMGQGVLVANHTSLSSDFKVVRSIKAQRRWNTIKVNEPFAKNQIYTTKEDFDFVLDYIRSHCPKVK